MSDRLEAIAARYVQHLPTLPDETGLVIPLGDLRWLLEETERLRAVLARVTEERDRAMHECIDGVAERRAAPAAAEAERDRLTGELEEAVGLAEGFDRFRREAEARAAPVKEALKEAVAYFESKEQYGPLYHAWEQGDIGYFDDRELTFEETLDAIVDGQDVRTGIVQVGAIEVYRRIYAALAGAPGDRGEG